MELYKLSLILYEHELRGEHEASIRKRLVGQQEGSSKHGVWGWGLIRQLNGKDN